MYLTSIAAVALVADLRIDWRLVFSIRVHAVKVFFCVTALKALLEPVFQADGQSLQHLFPAFDIYKMDVVFHVGLAIVQTYTLYSLDISNVFLPRLAIIRPWNFATPATHRQYRIAHPPGELDHIAHRDLEQVFDGEAAVAQLAAHRD